MREKKKKGGIKPAPTKIIRINRPVFDSGAAPTPIQVLIYRVENVIMYENFDGR